MDYNDFYESYGEFEEEYELLKQSLIKSIKDEFIAKMERLEKENEELREIKRNFNAIKSDYEFKLKDIEDKMRRSRLAELLPDNIIQGFSVGEIRTDRQKCDKCDDNRRIHYKTPRGKDTYEYCECSEKDIHREPVVCELYKFTQSKTSWGGEMPKINKYYRKTVSSDYDSFSDYEAQIYNENMAFDTINGYRTVFLDKDDCQKYCDWLNAKTK